MFKDDNEKKVKEYIDIYQIGDVKECLILLYKQVINLGNLYDYWGTSMKKLGQIVSRALSGEHQTKWNEIMSSQQDFISNLSNRDTFINMSKKLSTEILGPNAVKDQETAMDKGMKLPNDKKLRGAIDQYATINKNMKFLGEEGKSFTMRELNKQIKKMLTPQMRLE